MMASFFVRFLPPEARSHPRASLGLKGYKKGEAGRADCISWGRHELEGTIV